MAEENCFDLAKFIFQIIVCHCGSVVKEFLERADKPAGSIPATLFSVSSLYRFFSV